MILGLSPLSNFTNFLNLAGALNAFGTVQVTAFGNSTALPTYADRFGKVANPNPILLGPDGRIPHPVFLLPQSYSFSVYDPSGNLLASYGPINPNQSLALEPVGSGCGWSPIGNGQTFYDLSGQIAAGGSLSTYLAGTSTPFQTWSNTSGSSLNPAVIPILTTGIINSAGIWIPNGVLVKFILKNAAGQTIFTADCVGGFQYGAKVRKGAFGQAAYGTVPFSTTRSISI